MILLQEPVLQLENRNGLVLISIFTRENIHRSARVWLMRD